MSPKTRAVIITVVAAGAVGLIAAVLIVTFRTRYAGTPIIIKGSSTAKPVEIISDISPKNDDYHPVEGTFNSIKVTEPTGKCVVYKFAVDDEFTFKLKSDPDVEEVYVDEKYLDYVGVEFKEGRFNYDSGNDTFITKEDRKLISLSIEIPSASCMNTSGSMPCPTKFPNPSWTDLVDLTVSLGTGYTCP